MLTMAAFLLIGATLFTSCKDDDKDETPAPAGAGKLMIIHASPNAPGVDLLLDNVKLNTAAVNFLDNTSYIGTTAGTRNLKINVAGTSTTALNANLPVVNGKSYSVFAADSVSKLSGVVFEDDLTAPTAGNAKVRFIHLSPNAPAVDIAVDGGAVVFPNAAFKSATTFATLPAGSYDLEVRVAGSTTVALDLDPITLTAGKIYTVYAKGFLGGTGAQALGAQIIVNN